MESCCAAAASYSLPRILGSPCLLTFSAVFGAALPPILDTNRVQGTADEMVSDAREVLYTPAPYQHYRMLLEVMADARNIRRNLHTVRKPDPRNFP